MLTALSIFSGFVSLLCIALAWINYRLVCNLDYLNPAVAGNPSHAKAVLHHLVIDTIKTQDWRQAATLREGLVESLQTLDQHADRAPLSAACHGLPESSAQR